MAVWLRYTNDGVRVSTIVDGKRLENTTLYEDEDDPLSCHVMALPELLGKLLEGEHGRNH